jgi:hypothetical protein
MTTRPDIVTNKDNHEEPQILANQHPESKRYIYPQVNDRFKGLAIWLGLAFIIMVILVQQFSGYS